MLNLMEILKLEYHFKFIVIRIIDEILSKNNLSRQEFTLSCLTAIVIT